ncbi:MAG TPA: sulfatase [Kofleriaceae bacterium]|nr:sulfatase [Kofleriaceae bacterium]
MSSPSDRLSFAAVALALAACAADDSLDLAASHVAIGTDGARPNVVVIMADDLDVRLMQTMLDLDLAPNIEEYLVDQGTTFASAFVSNALCCPSRATMLTGQYSHNNGVLGAGVREEHGGVDALSDTSTLATWLQATGYRTGHVGKYLNGYGSRFDTTTPSFQREYVPPGWDHWQALVGIGTYRMFRYLINDTRDGVQQLVWYNEDSVENYQTTVLARRAVSFIEDAHDQGGPFYLQVMSLAPHAEVDSEDDTRWDFAIRPDPQDEIDKPDRLALIRALAPPFVADPSWDFVTPESPSFLSRQGLSEADLANLTRFYRERLAAMLAVDDMVGDVVQALSRRGILDDTVIIFTSDNGWMWGQHRLVGKQVAYEESIRVPLYIRVPAPSRKKVKRMVVNADLAPTIAELAGARPDLWVDGRSLVQFLSPDVPSTPWRRRLLVEHWGREHHVPTYAALRTRRYLYVDYLETSPPTQELYDLELDPFQTSNVHGSPDYAHAVTVLEQQLADMRGCALGSCQQLEE